MLYMQPGDYFTEEEIQQFIKVAENKTEIGDIFVYDFKTDKYNSLDRLSIVEVTKEVDCYDKQYTKHLIHANYFEGTGLFINSQNGEHIPALIAKLAETEQSSAQKMIKRYHDTFLQSHEVISTSEKMLADTNLMIQYLKKNKIKVKDLNFDMAQLHNLSNDEDALEKEVKIIAKRLPESIKIEGYNDSDYYPYLFDKFYIIEDIASSKMLFCKQEGNKTTWYKTERWNEEFEIDDRIHEFIHTQHQLPKSHISNLNEFNLVVEYESDKITKATVEIEYLNLLQGYIVNTLVEEGKIKQGLPDFSFEELLHNYTFQKEFYHIEERAIVELLQEIKIIDGKMTYDGFSEVDPKKVKKALKHEEIGEHHMRDLVPPQQDPNSGMILLNMTDFSGLVKLEKKHVDSVNEYLAKLQARDNTEMTATFISLIEGKLPTFGANLKRKI